MTDSDLEARLRELERQYDRMSERATLIQRATEDRAGRMEATLSDLSRKIDESRRDTKTMMWAVILLFSGTMVNQVFGLL